MEKKFLVLCSLFFIFACAHQVSVAISPSTSTKWMDQEDYTSYVNFFPRGPASVGTQNSMYHMTGKCDGFPRIDVKTAPGFCVGQVYDGSGLGKPRTSVAINSHELIIADMGSWNLYDGKIFHLSFDNNHSVLKEIFSKKSFSNSADPRREIINRPHQITKHTDGKYYVGTNSAILRFDPLSPKPLETIEVLIKNIPAEGLHPLKAFTFGEDGSLFVNVGASTNVCHKNSSDGLLGNRKNICEEAENLEMGQGQIRRYKMNSDGSIALGFEVYAKGLRNSMALVWDFEKNILIQGENSRDAIDKLAPNLSDADLPHDELNIVEKDKHYGWPYCFDNNQNSPEWKQIKCDLYQKPYMFLPEHSAPLAFYIYHGPMFPEWYRGRLLATLHGYRPRGHRIVAFKRDESGLPTGVPQSVVYGWDTKGEQKLGSPVGLTELPDGSMIIVEDNSKKILRLFYDPAAGDGKPVEEVGNVHSESDVKRSTEEEARKVKLLKKLQTRDVPPFALFQNKVIDKSCYVCHGGVNAPGIQLLRYDDEGNESRIIKTNKALEIYSMIKSSPNFPPMPPQGFSNGEEAQEAVSLFEHWLQKMKILF